MANAGLNEELVEAMKEFLTPKFMVTKDSDGEPNVVPVMSWTVYEGNTLVYGDFMTYKSRKNVTNGNTRMAILVFTTDLDSWLIKADFESYHRNDEVYEFIAQTPLFRYNNYTNARGAGVAEAVWASQKYGISKLSVLSSFLKAKLAGRKVPTEETVEGNMPLNVMKRLSQMAAVKIIAYISDDGYPVAFPEFGMIPVSANRIVLKRVEEKRRGFALKDGMRVAISLVTLEPAAFQLKGHFREIDDSTGYIELDRVYTCSLPRPGVRVDIPMLTREA
ncbi:MAG: pyridoxamine 5'-phosphate oxidase family protein [Candidatus Thorarchaeota archaeon]